MYSHWFERPVLAGRHVRLEPLTVAHAAGLFEACADPAMWTWLSEGRPGDAAGMRTLLEKALAQADRVPWVQLDATTGEPAGITSYYELSPEHRSLHIGYTWLGPRWHRTGVNTEAKLMLLERAFDQLGAVRVGWHTHSRNTRSQRAIERLGAQREGVLRSHRTCPDGSVRDTVLYSMVRQEWPAARKALWARLR